MIGGMDGIIYDPFRATQAQIINESMTEVRQSSDRKLRAVVRAYRSLPLVYRLFIWPVNPELQFRRVMRYELAKAVLLGEVQRRQL